MGDGRPFEVAAEGLKVFLRLQPNAGHNALGGLTRRADGQAVLQAKVTAAPQDGRANAALIKLLAKAWKLPKGQITLLAGHKDRNKTLLIGGDGPALEARLSAWLLDADGAAKS